MKAKCEVCFLLDDDATKKEVTYCKACDSWICKEDKNNWLRRGLAALKKRI